MKIAKKPTQQERHLRMRRIQNRPPLYAVFTRRETISSHLNVPTRSQSILSKLGKIRQALTLENAWTLHEPRSAELFFSENQQTCKHSEPGFLGRGPRKLKFELLKFWTSHAFPILK